MTSDTRNKLLEAEYFFNRMKETQSDRFAFQYNLSAFLSAARSVTWIMQKEFGKLPRFTEWYKKIQIEMRRDGDMKFLKNKRNFTIKEKPPPLREQVDVTIRVPTVNITLMAYPPTVIVTRTDGTIERVEPERPLSPMPTKIDMIPSEGKTTTEWRWYFDDLPDKDIVTFCEEQLLKLKALVAECESQFSC